MPADRTRALRGALAGAVAAGVWALQQPLDKRVFRSGYDDVELLGKAVARGQAWYPAGLAIHMLNGAVFGAVYSQAAPLAPTRVPAWLRGPAAGLAEHVALWPLGRVTDRFHPARDELTPLTGNRAAFAQATWRHLLFGTVLGELERRINAEPDEAPPAFEGVVSTNGHGDLEAAVVARPAS